MSTLWIPHHARPVSTFAPLVPRDVVHEDSSVKLPAIVSSRDQHLAPVLRGAAGGEGEGRRCRTLPVKDAPLGLQGEGLV